MKKARLFLTTVLLALTLIVSSPQFTYADDGGGSQGGTEKKQNQESKSGAINTLILVIRVYGFLW